MKLSQFLGRMAPALAPLILLGMIVYYGISVPYWDEWSTPGEFLAKDTRTFQDYFAQSNESRLVVPKLIFAGVNKFAGWHPKHYMIFGWAIVVAIFLLLHRFCYRRPAPGHKQDWVGLLCLTLTSALLFSPAAYENWLWGLQWVIFVPLLCALFAFRLQSCTRSFAIRFAGTALLNLVGMYTFSNGMLLWIASFPFWSEVLAWLAGRRPSRARMLRWLLWSAAYALLALASVKYYFHNYEVISRHPPLDYVLQQPLMVIIYFAAWCGGPFHVSRLMHIAAGLTMLAAMLLMGILLTKRIRNEQGWRSVYYLRKLYPALLVIAYAIGSGAMTALGRAGFGIEQAYSPRYLFHSGALVMGLIAALHTHRLLAVRMRRESPRYTRGFLAVLAVLSFLLIRTWHHACPSFALMKAMRTQNLLSIRMLAMTPASPMVEKTCPWVNLPALVRTLDEKGIYRTAHFGEWLTTAARNPQAESGGNARIGLQPDGDLRVTGWSIIPEQNTPADSVLICKTGADGNPEPWFMLAVGLARADLAKATANSPLLKTGFYESFPWKGDTSSLRLFSLDEKNRRLYPISRIP